jgi:hypothetical protein
MLNHPNENLEWNGERLINEQPHDEEAPEPRKHNYFSPGRYYCVETICAPCGVVIAWTKFAKAESETNILDFLTATYPNEATRPDYAILYHAPPYTNGLHWTPLDSHRTLVGVPVEFTGVHRSPP